MLKDIAPKGRPAATRSARKFRRKMTLPEVILWHWLRQRPDGLKFRRQHPTGPYVLDFSAAMRGWRLRWTENRIRWDTSQSEMRLGTNGCVRRESKRFGFLPQMS